MNNEMYSPAEVLPLSEISLASHFPKLIAKNVDDLTGMLLVTRPSDYDPAFPPQWTTVDTVVIQPTTTHLDDYVMGENYETLALTLPSGKNLVVSKKVQTPQLVKIDSTSFHWASAPGDKSRIFRGVIPIGEQPSPEHYSVVAELTSTSSSTTFTDKFPRNLDDFYYLYYVVSPYGVTAPISLL